MKYLTILLITLIPFLSHSQATTYVGLTGTPNYVGFSITSEIEYDFVLMSLQTNINNYDPTFKGRLGLQVGNKIKMVMFLPIFNYSLTEYAYNTSVNVEFRYKPTVISTEFLLIAGAEFYKNKPNYYLTISIPFK